MIIIILCLIILQALRIGLKALIFSFAEKTLFADAVYSLSFMAIIGCLILLFAKRQSYDLSIMPTKFSRPYIIATIVVGAILISTPFITRDASLYNIVFLAYGALVTPFFEEVIFRGCIWKAVECNTIAVNGEKAAFIVSTLLFGLWHLGYADTIIWRTSMFFPDANIPEIMFWKVITGLVIGALAGALRYKTKNIYPAMLLHCLINTIGS